MRIGVPGTVKVLSASPTTKCERIAGTVPTAPTCSGFPLSLSPLRTFCRVFIDGLFTVSSLSRGAPFPCEGCSASTCARKSPLLAFLRQCKLCCSPWCTTTRPAAACACLWLSAQLTVSATVPSIHILCVRHPIFVQLV